MGIFDFFRRKPSGPPPPPASASESASDQTDDRAAIDAVFAELEALRRTPMLAEIGGFQPPDDPRTSWFGRGVGLPGEGLPEREGKPLFPLLQINVAELPSVPPEFAGTALLVVFLDIDDIPFDQPHGEGWLIREYASLDGLEPLPAYPGGKAPRAFPVRWELGEPEGPGWDDACELMDLGPVDDDPEASDEFFDRFQNSPRTKVGGYPHDIQHAVGLDGYVFQIGSEDKPRWNLVDGGVAYFFKAADGEWRWECQFY